MLRWLRKRHVTKRILWGIAAMIVPAFVLWGVGSAVRSGRLSQTIATLDGAKIGVNDYLKNLRAVEHFTRLLHGDQARHQMNEETLRAEAWDRTLLLVEAKRRKLTASDNEVIAYIRSLPFLQRPGGGFDLRTYEYVMRHAIGASPREFEDEVRQQLLILKLRQAVAEEAAVTDDELRAQFEAEHQPFRIAYALVRSSETAGLPEPTAEQLRQHYESHPDRFLVPEQVSLRYLFLPKPPATADAATQPPAPPTTDNAEAQVDAAEEAAAPAAEGIERLRRRAERLVDRILADASQSPFAAIAQLEGLEVKETGWFGTDDPIPGIGYERAVSQAAFALVANDVSDPVETVAGFYILQPTGRRPAHRAPLEEVTDRVREEWLATQRQEAARTRAESLLSTLREAAGRLPGAPLEELAAPLDIEIRRTEPLTSTGYVSGLGPSVLFAAAIKTLRDGELAPSVVETPVGFAVVQLVERLPVDESLWASEQETLRQRLLIERRRTHYDDWLDALRRRAVILTRPDEALDDAEVEEE